MDVCIPLSIASPHTHSHFYTIESDECCGNSTSIKSMEMVRENGKYSSTNFVDRMIHPKK